MWDALFAGGAAWFAIPALIGTGVFVIKLILLLLGGSDDLDLGGSAGSSADALHSAHGDAHGLVTILSVQGVSAFLMGFGWTGLAAIQGLAWGRLPAMGLAVVGGVLMCGLLMLMLAGTRRLATSGNVNYQRAVGTEAEVYALIPADGRGQVRLIVDGRQRIVNAVSESGQLDTGSRVRVLEVKPDNSVVVRGI